MLKINDIPTLHTYPIDTYIFTVFMEHVDSGLIFSTDMLAESAEQVERFVEYCIRYKSDSLHFHEIFKNREMSYFFDQLPLNTYYALDVEDVHQFILNRFEIVYYDNSGLRYNVSVE